MIVLTTEHEIYVVGQGGNGQLGLDVEELKDWKKISPLTTGKRIVGVHAGYKNTFLLVEDEKPLPYL